MFGLIHRGELPQVTENEFEHLTARLKALWLVEHNEDGTHIDSTGFLTGTGTAGKISKFLSSTELGDSIMSESGATITLAGGLTASGTIVGSVFSGSGAGLTNVPAGQLTGTVADARLTSNVPLLNFSTSLDWTNCNTIVVAPGVDVISAAVTAMQNGDVIILGAGTYTQTVAISIPVTVTRFAIIGQGADITTINYTNDTNGIVSDMTNDAYRILIARIRGFSMVYNNLAAGTLTGILLWGSSYESYVHGSILISDIAMHYGSLNDTCFAVGIQLIDVRSSYITHCNIRTSPSNRVQEGIVLHSCMNIRITSCWIMSCNNGIRLVKALDALIKDPVTKHGCEDIHVQNTTFYIFNTGIVLGYKCFAVKFNGVEFSRPGTGYAIVEDVSLGTTAGGYHIIDNCYFDNDANMDNNFAYIYLARPGTVVRGSQFVETSTMGGFGCNGIIADTTATLTNVTDCIFRSFGRGGAAGVFSVADDCKIMGNMFETTNAAGFDISIGAGADRNVVAFNSIDQAIADAGTATVLVTNTVH